MKKRKYIGIPDKIKIRSWVDFHGSYKPAGLRRTYPNVITREGVRGLEHNKWADYITAEHNLTLPFIRQFSRVERSWYLQAPYPNLQRWLAIQLQSKLYSKAMTKYPLWLDTHEDIIFGGS